MEAFEHVVKVYLEGQGYIVTSNVKFHIRRRTKKAGREEYQTHGYEVDLVAARHGTMILGFVKSFLGSRGVNRDGFWFADTPRERDLGLYRVFNQPELRKDIVVKASERYGYPLEAIQTALYVGKFASHQDEDVIRAQLGHDGIAVVGLPEIMQKLQPLADSKTYVNDPVIMTLKCVKEIGGSTGGAGQ
jgi:hypothetical protein